MLRREELPANLKALTRRNAARLDHETFRTDIQRILTAVDRAINHAQGPRVVDSFTAPPPSLQQSVHAPRPPASQPPIPVQHSKLASWLPAVERDPAMLPPSRTDVSAQIPLYRAVVRIGLWGAIASFSLFTLVGTTLTIKLPKNVGSSVGLILMFAGLTGLLILGLLFEIRAERAILDRGAVDQDDPARRPVSSKRIRNISLCWIVACSLFALMIAL
jgi:hypothetical protein